MSDLISRQDALMEARPEHLNPKQEKLASYNQGWNDALDEYWDGIKELPSAEETGKWVKQDNGYFFCSKCGKYPENQASKTDFCPNCGAKMDGDTER